ncbi:hypothetical protein SH668x_003075 [Planctomicrobium sp. SH668]
MVACSFILDVGVADLSPSPLVTNLKLKSTLRLTVRLTVRLSA